MQHTINGKQINKCPEDCTFDWVEFHDRIDTALVHMIDELDASLSRTSSLEFLEYSHRKSILAKPTVTEPEETA